MLILINYLLSSLFLENLPAQVCVFSGVPHVSEMLFTFLSSFSSAFYVGPSPQVNFSVQLLNFSMSELLFDSFL